LNVLLKMILDRKVSPVIVRLVLFIGVTLVIAVPLITRSLHPQYRMELQVQRYLDGVKPQWEEMIKHHQEFKDAKFLVSSHPRILVTGEVGLGGNFNALREFFRMNRPPEPVPMEIHLDLVEAGILIDRYEARFPEDSDGRFVIGGDIPASPSDGNHQAEQVVPSDGHKPSNSIPTTGTTAPADAH